jgi:transposase
MTDTTTRCAGPAARPTRWRRRPAPSRCWRMSARRKQSAVLRLLRGEDLELVSSGRGEASLKTRPADGRDVEIGDLTIVNELLAMKID